MSAATIAWQVTRMFDETRRMEERLRARQKEEQAEREKLFEAQRQKSFNGSSGRKPKVKPVAKPADENFDDHDHFSTGGFHF
ncbi:MAG: hypothetical protein ACAH80_00775 [Alphaproteobacteria bacterium]